MKIMKNAEQIFPSRKEYRERNIALEGAGKIIRNERGRSKANYDRGRSVQHHLSHWWIPRDRHQQKVKTFLRGCNWEVLTQINAPPITTGFLGYGAEALGIAYIKTIEDQFASVINGVKEGWEAFALGSKGATVRVYVFLTKTPDNGENKESGAVRRSIKVQEHNSGFYWYCHCQKDLKNKEKLSNTCSFTSVSTFLPCLRACVHIGNGAKTSRDRAHLKSQVPANELRLSRLHLWPPPYTFQS